MSLNQAKMYRFLFSSTPGYGHLHPLIPLGQTLRQAGHQVAFAVRPSRQKLIEQAGFSFLPVAENISEDAEYQKVQAQLAQMPLNLESETFAYPRIFGGISTRLKIPHLLAVAEKWQPDMLIREAADYAAVLVAERLGVPHATVAFATALKGMNIFERELAEQLEPLRAKWGLAPDPTLSALNRYLCLSYTPPRFGLENLGLAENSGNPPATTHFIRPEIFDQAESASLPVWIENLPKQPTVYVTLGTEVNSEPELYPSILQTIIAGLRDLPLNLIVTLGRDKDPADFGEQPANVHIERYIPQSSLLPYCDLIVMHGGSNTLLAVLENSLPMVIIPLIADQFFNALAAEKLGLAQVVQRENLTPESIRAAVETTLGNPSYRQNIGQLRTEMETLPDQKYAVELVERVATERKPIFNSI